MRRFLSMIAGLLMSSSLPGAHWMPLHPDGRRQLQTLLACEPAAAERFTEIERTARPALDRPPNPIPEIVYEGRLETDPARIKTRAAMAELAQLDALSQAWLVTADERYARAARANVMEWIRRTTPTGNPINDNKLVPLLDAFRLLGSTFSSAQRTEIETWIHHLAEAEMRTGAQDAGTGRAKGNWQTKRLKLIAYAGLLLDEPSYVDYAVAGTRDYIDDNLFADGTSFDFRYRDALHYHVSGLIGLLEIAVALAPLGHDLYHHTGRQGGSAALSVAWMEPFLTGAKSHPEWVNSQAGFDRTRAAAGDPEFTVGRTYEPERAAPMLELAGVFEPRWRELARRVGGPDASAYPTWMSVLTAATRPPSACP